ncbi:MAG TPA: (Fe-S)-binding protein, partial [Actinoplanes sp.]|nr:(Fe-S)-binding protein [Actinoplanes sp.]
SREDWTKGLDFHVPRVGEVDDFEYLFWVGCAGAFEDRAKKTTRAVATLLHEAGVDYAILGEGETCTGDPARRIGNEFVFQMLAAQNVETLNEANVKKIVATCPHCFNTLGNEYEQVGGKFEVVHHTQLLAHLDVLALAEGNRPLIGAEADGGVIDPDVLWSCTTCGACVEQCPVDIEHVDHIVDMRRYQVLIESNFPPEAGVMLRNLENKGNPWGAPQQSREDWTKGLDFHVPRVGEVDDFEYLFWVGCAGAFEDRAKKTTRAVATLLHEAGVDYAILGEGETCTGDPARRIGNEFLFQMLAAQNVETLNEAGVKKIVATCPHCFNTLGNEYEQVGGKFEVVHHTQLLAHLVATGKLTPVQPVDGGVTYHDPCYLGRHNRVFEAPRELLGSAVGSAGPDGVAGGLVEMPRNSERSFCCGAGGARMWMEERIGKRINVERTQEALATGAKTIAVGCPFCYTMIGDGVTGQGEHDNVEVMDVASVLLRSIKPTT